MCHGFQITYFNIQQLSIVLIMALLEHFINDTNVAIVPIELGESDLM